jgi:hypothetical protein
MRAINTTTLQLHDVDPEDSDIRYAILSHTWDNDEVLFDDVRNLGPGELTANVRNKGASKVINSCIQAKQDGYDYIWVDTCCIDKSSSAELSEAINSMFQWYALADECYAYLGDVTVAEFIAQDPLHVSRWFSRGWTVQELVAPSSLVFFDREWVRIGAREEFASWIAEITSIDQSFLQPRPASISSSSLQNQLGTLPVSTRLAWARNRETTRGEDLAYCLMGLFDVNMPLLYGEGEEKAFFRLQREIIMARSDQSILAWTRPTRSWLQDGSWAKTSILAPSPRVHFLPAAKDPLPGLSSLGSLSLQGSRVQATVFLAKMRFDTSPLAGSYVAVLQFQESGSEDFLSRPALHLERLHVASGDTVYRKATNNVFRLHMGHNGQISTSLVQPGFGSPTGTCRCRIFIWAYTCPIYGSVFLS